MKVLVAMSGGVDSSVAAAELIDQGHEVVGVTMRFGVAKATPVAARCLMSTTHGELPNNSA